MINVPTSMMLDQFMVLATTGVTIGQVRKKISGVRKHNAATLMARPSFPSDHLRIGSAGPTMRRWSTHPMVRKYETSTAKAPREVIAAKATDEPRLMSEMSEVIVMETMTAGRGMFQPGETCYTVSWRFCAHTSIGLTRDSQGEPGKPLSRANDQICLDAVATSLIQQAVKRTIISAVMVFAAA